MVQVRGKIAYKDTHVTAYLDMDYTGIARYAMESEDLGRILDEIAESAKRYAISISPYDNRSDQYRSRPGQPHYRDSWDILPYTERRTGDPPFPRQARLLMNDSPQALEVEFGSGRGTSEEQYYGHRIFPKIFDYLEGRP